MADCLVITGATATGKTDIAIEVAQQLDGEIISFDSRQVYQHMDIGTAKPTSDQRAAVPHHGLDLLPPSRQYNAGKFAEDARGWMADIRGRGKLPILVGGTGFFLRALTHPMFEEPQIDEARKDALKHVLNLKTRTELIAWLRHLDPEAARQADEQTTRQRIARLLEVVLLTGRPLEWWQQHAQPTEPPIDAVTFVLELERTQLYQRINERVQQMIRAGLVQEVESLLAAGYNEHSPGMKTTGYIELIPYVRGQCTLQEAIDAIQRATRAYARRQITWFRHQLAEPVIRIDAGKSRKTVVDAIVQEWAERAHRN